jgi:hypothetical protein
MDHPVAWNVQSRVQIPAEFENWQSHKEVLKRKPQGLELARSQKEAGLLPP